MAKNRIRRSLRRYSQSIVTHVFLRFRSHTRSETKVCLGLPKYCKSVPGYLWPSPFSFSYSSSLSYLTSHGRLQSPQFFASSTNVEFLITLDKKRGCCSAKRAHTRPSVITERLCLPTKLGWHDHNVSQSGWIMCPASDWPCHISKSTPSWSIVFPSSPLILTGD